MKTNEAPEKIYILPHKDYSDRRIMNAFTEKEDSKDIEYIRTDTFIKKAYKWLEENVEKHISADGEYTVYYEEMFEEFKNYMKGE